MYKRDKFGRFMKGSGFLHGMHGTPFYKVWDSMICRCNYKSHQRYKSYGRGKRIKEKYPIDKDL